MKARFLTTILAVCASLSVCVSCADDDSFSTSSSNRLSFSADTISLDTVFSRVPTATYTFWVYNKSGDGLRCSNVKLNSGNQIGFRVNVDGTYLSQAMGYQTNGIEIRKNDSIRVFVELTSALTNSEDPQLVSDDLVFTLESGVQQKVNLRAMSWDATMLRSLVVSRDTTISGSKPIVVYGGITVNEGATLTISPGTTLYFHSDAGLDVHGTLKSVGTAEANVVLRGDRLDRMFAYLPYDNVSGQWNGVRFHATSFDNVIDYTDIHSTNDGIVCDSSDVARQTLTLSNSVVHNCQGYGVQTENVAFSIENCQLSNTLNDCLSVSGGIGTVNNCTLAQFYPFDAERGAALSFRNGYANKPMPLQLDVRNSIITGYADDVLSGVKVDTVTAFEYSFDHCIIRTPVDSTDERLTNVVFEDVEDTTMYGEKHFMKVDIGLQSYDFRLSGKSAAIGKANPETATPADRLGLRRDEEPDAGCYECVEQTEN